MILPRFYPILDTSFCLARGCGVRQAAEALLEAGCGILQLRHKADFTREAFESAREISALCREAGATFIINDRADIARLLDAGVHVGQDDLPPGCARKIVGPRALGLSTHNEAQLREAAGAPADYLALGPIYVTSSKQNPDPPLGTDELRRLRPLTVKPLVAIGGVTIERAAAVLAAGADSIAIISGLFPPGITKCALRERAEEWIRAAA